MNRLRAVENHKKYKILFSKKRLILFSFLGLLLLFGLSSCTNKNGLEYRLGEFYSFLDEPTIIAFKSGDLALVLVYLQEKIDIDPEFFSQLKELKKKEAIGLFSLDQVIYYYYHFFYIQIEKKKNAD